MIKGPLKDLKTDTVILVQGLFILEQLLRLRYVDTYVKLKRREVGVDKMMNVVELKSCYICGKPVFPEDKIAEKKINDVHKVRHLWHRIPNSGSYFFNLADAKIFLEKLVDSEKYSKDSYVLSESRDILEDIERLLKIEG